MSADGGNTLLEYDQLVHDFVVLLVDAQTRIANYIDWEIPLAKKDADEIAAHLSKLTERWRPLPHPRIEADIMKYGKTRAQQEAARHPPLSREGIGVETTERAAKLLAELVRTSWDGLREGRIGDKGFPLWSTNGIGHTTFQGGKQDLLDLAEKILAQRNAGVLADERQREIENWLERPEGHTLPRRDGPWMTIIEPKQGQAIADAIERGEFRPKGEDK